MGCFEKARRFDYRCFDWWFDGRLEEKYLVFFIARTQTPIFFSTPISYELLSTSYC